MKTLTAMRKITIKQIELINFKGLSLTFDNFDAAQNILHGPNGSGKTTIADAFLWVLADTLTSGAKSPDVRRRNIDTGDVMHNCPAEAHIVINNGLFDIRLSKIAKEQWGTIKGQKDKVLKGVNNQYFINDVLTKQGDFHSYITNEIVDREMISILVNPYAFGRLDSSARKKILKEMAGEVSNEELLSKATELQHVYDNIAITTIENYISSLRAAKKKSVSEVDSNEAKIEELRRKSYPSEEDSAVASNRKSRLEKELADKTAQIDNSDIDVLQEEIAATRKDINELNITFNKSISEKSDTLQKRIEEITQNKILINREISQLHQKNETYQEQISRGRTKLNEVKERFQLVSDTVFDNNSVVCPTCATPYAEDKLEGIKEAFYTNKREELTKINEEGKSCQIQLQGVITRKQQIEAELEFKQVELGSIESAITKLAAEQDKLPTLSLLQEDSVEYARLLDAQAKAQTLLNKLIDSKPAPFNSTELLAKIDEQSKIILAYQDSLDNNKRIQELDNLITSATAESAEIDCKIDDCIMWQRLTMDIVSDRLSKYFNLVRFNFLSDLLNGNNKDVCDIYVNNISYDTSLNLAGRINAGIDIINGLSSFHNCSLPIFVDNSESVIEVIATTNQIIKLEVSKNDTLLTLN